MQRETALSNANCKTIRLYVGYLCSLLLRCVNRVPSSLDPGRRYHTVVYLGFGKEGDQNFFITDCFKKFLTDNSVSTPLSLNPSSLLNLHQHPPSWPSHFVSNAKPFLRRLSWGPSPNNTHSLNLKLSNAEWPTWVRQWVVNVCSILTCFLNR